MVGIQKQAAGQHPTCNQCLSSCGGSHTLPPWLHVTSLILRGEKKKVRKEVEEEGRVLLFGCFQMPTLFTGGTTPFARRLHMPPQVHQTQKHRHHTIAFQLRDPRGCCYFDNAQSMPPRNATLDITATFSEHLHRTPRALILLQARH